MLLKEIDMDMPYIRDHKLVSDDEIKKDYEENWKVKRRQFQLSTRCMTSMIERLLPRIVTQDCWKIVVECVEEITNASCKKLLGVYCVQVEFDFKYFYQINNIKKKQYIISKVKTALLNEQLKTLIEVSEIEKVCDKICSLNYYNEWYWRKSIKNKGKNAQIKIVHEIDSVLIYILIFDKDNNIVKEKLLISSVPDERIYAQYLGEVVWISDSTVALISKKGEYFQMNL